SVDAVEDKLRQSLRRFQLLANHIGQDYRDRPANLHFVVAGGQGRDDVVGVVLQLARFGSAARPLPGFHIDGPGVRVGRDREISGGESERGKRKGETEHAFKYGVVLLGGSRASSLFPTVVFADSLRALRTGVGHTII